MSSLEMSCLLLFFVLCAVIKLTLVLSMPNCIMKDSYLENLIALTSTWFQVVPFYSLILEQFLFLLTDDFLRRL